MTDTQQIPLEIVGSGGQTIATVHLAAPLKLPLGHAMDLIAKLAGEDAPVGSDVGAFGESGTPLVLAAVPDFDSEAERRKEEEATIRNLRARAESYDLDGLRRWLQTLDPANGHMSVAYDIVTERIAELEALPEPQSIRADTAVQQRLVAQARELEASYLADLDLAEGGDENARLRAQQTRSRLVELQEDIRDGVDRSGPQDGSA